MKTGVALKPKCPADDLTPYLALCDMALVMTVEPGFGGQKFMADMLPKIRAIRAMAKPEMMIQVDGGIGVGNIGLCAEVGADCFVVGTSSFRAPDMRAALTEMKATAELAAK